MKTLPIDDRIAPFRFAPKGVADLQVAGVPRAKYGQEGGAFIISRPNADLTAEDVRDVCRGRIGRHKIPAHAALVAPYSLTAGGKVQQYKRQELSRALSGLADPLEKQS